MSRQGLFGTVEGISKLCSQQEIDELTHFLNGFEHGCLMLRKMKMVETAGHYSYYDKKSGLIFNGGMGAYNAGQSPLTVEQFVQLYGMDRVGVLNAWDFHLITGDTKVAY